MAIRNELGQSFFDATAAWQRKPNTNNEEEVKNTLNIYSKNITKRVKQSKSLQKIVIDSIAKDNNSIQNILLGGSTLTIASIGAIDPMFPVFAATIGLGYLVIKTLSKSDCNYTISFSKDPYIKSRGVDFTFE